MAKYIALYKTGQSNGGLPLDPFRAADGRKPTAENVARGILAHPQILQEVARLAVWFAPGVLDAWNQSVAETQARKAELLTACSEGNADYHFARLIGEEAP